MIYISKRSSGLGDMLLHIAHGLWFTQTLGAKIHVDWRRNFFLGRKGHICNNGFLRFFEAPENWVDLPDISQITTDLSVLPSVRFLSDPSYREAPWIRLLETFALTGKCTPFDIAVSSNVHDFLPWSVASKYLAKIKPVQSLREESYSLARTVREDAQIVYGVHIRHGNGELYDLDSPEEELLFDAYKNALIPLQSKGIQFFLVTDSIRVHEWFSNEIGSFHTNPDITLPKEFGKAVHHVGRHREIDPQDVLRGSIVDMLLLSAFDGMVCDTWSNFSKYSRALGNFDRGRNLIQIKPPRKSRRLRKIEVETRKHGKRKVLGRTTSL